MTNEEIIEVLLLRNRGVLHSRVFEPFSTDAVSTVYLGLIERGHLVEVAPEPGEHRSTMRLGFHVKLTPSGRNRLEVLEKMLAVRGGLGDDGGTIQ
jgi:hypothetical protein